MADKNAQGPSLRQSRTDLLPAESTTDATGIRRTRWPVINGRMGAKQPAKKSAKTEHWTQAVVVLVVEEGGDVLAQTA